MKKICALSLLALLLAVSMMWYSKMAKTEEFSAQPVAELETVTADTFTVTNEIVQQVNVLNITNVVNVVTENEVAGEVASDDAAEAQVNALGLSFNHTFKTVAK